MTGPNKPDFTSSIVMVKAGETIPAGLLRKLAEENMSALGLCVREPDKLVVEKFPKIEDFDKHWALLQQLNEGTKKHHTMFCFHDFPVEFDEDETMPWVVLRDSKKNPLLVVALEGDFPGRDNEEGFSDAYDVMNEWLGPKIEQMYKTVGNSPQKLTEYLKSAQFQADLKLVWSHRGSFAFMPTVGEPFTIEENAIGVVGPWGSASNAYGYTEAALEAATNEAIEEQPEPVAEPPRKSRYAEPLPSVDPPKANPKPVTDPIEKVAAQVVDQWVDWKADPSLHGKALKEAYRAADPNGKLVKNWNQRPTIKIRAKTAVSGAGVTAPKDMKAPAPEPVAVIPSLPVISGEQQQKAVDFIKKHLADGSAVISDPLDAQRDEAKLAKFSGLVLKTGKLDEINSWKTSFIFALNKQHNEVGALAIIELRNRVRDLEMMLANIKVSDIAGTEQVANPAAGAQSQPGPAPAEAVPAAPKKSRYV